MVVVSNGPPSSPLIVHDMPQYGSFRVIVRGGGGGAVLQCGVCGPGDHIIVVASR